MDLEYATGDGYLPGPTGGIPMVINTAPTEEPSGIVHYTKHHKLWSYTFFKFWLLCIMAYVDWNLECDPAHIQFWGNLRYLQYYMLFTTLIQMVSIIIGFHYTFVGSDVFSFVLLVLYLCFNVAVLVGFKYCTSASIWFFTQTFDACVWLGVLIQHLRHNRGYVRIY